MDLTKQAYDYSLRLAELVKFLREDGKGFPLSDELLSCGVEVGMTLQKPDEAGRRQAARALQRADYLLEMAVGAGYLTGRQSVHIREEGRVLLSMLNEQTENHETTRRNER